MLPGGIKSGTGSKVTLTPEEAGTAIIKGFYQGKPYKAILDGQETISEFHVPVSEVPYRIDAKFTDGADYSLNQVLELKTAKCGRCVGTNVKPVKREEVRVSGDMNGRDPIDYAEVVPNDKVTSIKIFLNQKMKISKDGEDMTLTIKYGPESKTYHFVIFPN